MPSAAELLARIRTDPGLEEFCAGHGIDLLVLFGSALTDAATAHDVDLAYLAANDVAQVERCAPASRRIEFLRSINGRRLAMRASG